jgi:hypothetical protein
MFKKAPTGRVIRVVVDPEQQATLLQAATRANLPLATWVRVVALKEAQRDQPKSNSQE